MAKKPPSDNSTVATSNTAQTTAASGVGPLVMGARGYTVTLPPEDDFYLVKREQLEELDSAGRTLALEVSLLCAGGAIGYIPSVIETYQDYQKSAILTGYQITFSVLFGILVVLSLAKLLEHRKTKTKLDTLVAKIKAGQKVQVRAETRST